MGLNFQYIVKTSQRIPCKKLANFQFYEKRPKIDLAKKCQNNFFFPN
jgi:hypothetical protein